MRPLEHPIPNTCFMSCVKIIGQDLWFDLDILAFIDLFSDICHENSVRGAFHVRRENLKTISGVMGFRADFLFDLGLPLESEYLGDSRVLLSFHRFQDTDLHAHCLVFIGVADDSRLRVICPSKNDYNFIPSGIFTKWQCNPVLIRAA